jgi:hypothetical protein
VRLLCHKAQARVGNERAEASLNRGLLACDNNKRFYV